MPLATNLDLLRLEPRIFTDAADSGLTLLSASDAAVSGSTVTSAASDFIDLGLTLADVVVVNGEPVEVLAINSATSLDVSRRRFDDASPTLAPESGTALSLSVISFAPLLARLEAEVLAALGIDANDAVQPIETTQVVNLDDLAHLVGLRVVARAFARSSAVNPASVSLDALAQHYDELAREAARAMVARIDLDGDGVGEVARRLAAPAAVRR